MGKHRLHIPSCWNQSRLCLAVFDQEVYRTHYSAYLDIPWSIVCIIITPFAQPSRRSRVAKRRRRRPYGNATGLLTRHDFLYHSVFLQMWTTHRIFYIWLVIFYGCFHSRPSPPCRVAVFVYQDFFKFSFRFLSNVAKLFRTPPKNNYNCYCAIAVCDIMRMYSEVVFPDFFQIIYISKQNQFSNTVWRFQFSDIVWIITWRNYRLADE